MNKEKQIEQMQNTLIQISKQPIMIDGLEHWSDVIAEELYDNGYRKAEDVAREIFEEIEKVVNFALCVDITDWSAYNELKKKYTESSNEITEGEG